MRGVDSFLRQLEEAKGPNVTPEEARFLDDLISTSRRCFEELLAKANPAEGTQGAIVLSPSEMQRSLSTVVDMLELGRAKPELKEVSTRIAGYSEMIWGVAKEAERSLFRLTGAPLVVAERQISALERDLASDSVVGDQRLHALTLLEIGSLHDDIGNHLSALSCFRRSCFLARDVDDKGLYFMGLHLVGVSYRSLLRPETAIPYLEECVEFWTTVEDVNAHATSIAELGLCRECLGELDEAERCFLVASEDFRRTEDQGDNLLRCLQALQRIRSK